MLFRSEAVSQQLNMLQAVLDDTSRAREALEGLSKEPSRELLVPLGANVFIHAEAKKGGKVLSGIGASFSMEKSWEDAELQLAKRADEVQKEIQRLAEGAMRMQAEASRLEEELNEEMERGAGKR